MGKVKNYIKKCNMDDVVDLFNEYIGFYADIPPSKLVPIKNAPADDPRNGLNAYCATYYIKPMQLFEAVEMERTDGYDPMEKFLSCDYALFNYESATEGKLSFPDNEEIRRMVRDISDDIEKFFIPKIKSGEVPADSRVGKIFTAIDKANQAQR